MFDTEESEPAVLQTTRQHCLLPVLFWLESRSFHKGIRGHRILEKADGCTRHKNLQAAVQPARGSID